MSEMCRSLKLMPWAFLATFLATPLVSGEHLDATLSPKRDSFVVDEPIDLGFANLIGMEIQNTFPVVTLDREHLSKDRLQAQIPALGLRDIRLEKLLIRIGLQFDKVGRSDDFFDFSEINSFSSSRWHLDLY